MLSGSGLSGDSLFLPGLCDNAATKENARNDRTFGLMTTRAVRVGNDSIPYPEWFEQSGWET
jgi:hypothetical protein